LYRVGYTFDIIRFVDGSIGKQFLKDYFKRTDESFGVFFDAKIREANSISNIPAELLRRFAVTARKGKKIRGALLTLGYQMSGGTNNEAIDTASFIPELFHTAGLVHDDIMDQDNVRRGLPSLHYQYADMGKTLNISTDLMHYGESMAMDIADAVFFLSWDVLLNLPFDDNLIRKTGLIYSQYVTRCAYGQALDVTNIEIDGATEEDILKVHKYKTAEYTGVMPLLMGSALAGDIDDTRKQAIIEYGTAFGWAFQIQDDILGIYADEQELGKPLGSDIEEGKNTLLTLHLSKHGTSEQKAFLKEVLGKENISAENVEKMREVLKDAGSFKYVYDLGLMYVENAKQAIPAVTSDKTYQDILESMAVFMMERAT